MYSVPSKELINFSLNLLEYLKTFPRNSDEGIFTTFLEAKLVTKKVFLPSRSTAIVF